MLPWEYLCLTKEAVDECRHQGMNIEKYQPNTRLPAEDTFLALHPHVSLVRQTNPQPPAAELERLGVLRVMVAWANPGPQKDGQGWGLISGIGVEVASIRNALRDLGGKLVEVRELEHATKAGLEQVMRDWKPHVLHFAGHGGFPNLDDPGDLAAPSLVLERKRKSAGKPHDYLTAEELRRLCAASGTQMVVLNACWGGRISPDFTGIAHALTAPSSGRAVPVVVAHQLPIPQTAAAGFSLPFYENVTVACPIEDAVRTFRRDSLDNPFGHGVPDWGVPVVFLGVRDSTLFSVVNPDPYPIDFRSLIDQHVSERRIVGRRFLHDAYARCRDAREQQRTGGTFLLVAPPGIGKTAFLAQWVKDDPDLVHFFYRATANVTDPDECVQSLYQGLRRRHRLRIRGEDPTKDMVALRRQLEVLLRDEVSPRCARGNRPETVLIDALDESGRAASDGKNAIEVLPGELPPHVYFLITSRPGPLADALTRRSGVERFDLDPSARDNQEDATAFCRQTLEEQMTGEDGAVLSRLAERLAQRAEGNFLVLTLFLKRVFRVGKVTVADLEHAAEGLTGAVEAEYEKFFERVLERLLGERDELEKRDLLNQVLGAFAAAPAPITPEQIGAAFRLRRAQWEWALGQAGQFLVRGGIRQEERGAPTYRIYHETFREYLQRRLAADLRDYHRRWAEYTLGWRELRGYARLYALRHLPAHLIAASQGA
jgi:hypothetical protein